MFLFLCFNSLVVTLFICNIQALRKAIRLPKRWRKDGVFIFTEPYLTIASLLEQSSETFLF